jgi:hypothetical protein
MGLFVGIVPPMTLQTVQRRMWRRLVIIRRNIDRDLAVTADHRHFIVVVAIKALLGIGGKILS